ncbi:hypothetical protein K1719_012323 [Acacia pycnantha]|nr:hypothetical protein K1719_012323 [Acacia pycnantha]
MNIWLDAMKKYFMVIDHSRGISWESPSLGICLGIWMMEVSSALLEIAKQCILGGILKMEIKRVIFVFLTIQPDFNVSLNDPTLTIRLKVHIQIVGAGEDSQAIMATLHHQVIYHLQNHSLDLHIPNSTHDALLAISNRADDTSIIQIPRQFPKEELSQFMPLE